MTEPMLVDIEAVVSEAPDNFVIRNAIVKCYDVLKEHKKVLCSVSGGADSDVMLDLILRCGGGDKTDFVFFNTGLEYRATLEHLDFLEKKYGITIKRVRPKKPIPLAVKQYGIPFLSKEDSEKLHYLQLHNFQWEDAPLEQLLQKYQKVKSPLAWWTDKREGTSGRYSIERHRFLREFITQNPPTFPISSYCCHCAKKKPSRDLEKRGGYDLKCLGMRKAEGGVRSTAFNSCFSVGKEADHFRPIWFFRDADKEEYCRHYGITHSRCYTEYGLKRTGCVGCPFNKKFDEELAITKQYEPQLYKACMNIFGESYDYTRRYRAFRDEMKKKEKELKESAKGDS